MAIVGDICVYIGLLLGIVGLVMVFLSRGEQFILRLQFKGQVFE